ncbi:4199_t:CDS:2 [Diversispora eburnea]|uniref:4199_t:CDS:1 n=1 Tax=Diversispora eburnea TaxID=1213867 RepID=A0A9N9A0X5_9GLOM|nr:4199_t:CDS:2 [Diversispora eburnea]
MKRRFFYADENRGKMNKSHEQKLLQSLYNFHPQSCYISSHIYTLYELQDSLEDIKSGKCADSEESSKWKQKF